MNAFFSILRLRSRIRAHGAVLLLGLAHAGVVSAQVGHNAFDQRRVLEGAPLVFDDTTRGATLEAGEPNHSGDASRPASGSIWYSWRAPGSGLAVVDLARSGFDTALGFYEGKSLDSLRVLARNDDAAAPAGLRTSRVLVPVEGGADYQIAVAGVGVNPVGDVHFELRLVTVPEIVEEPADRAVTYGESAEFRARVLGVPPLRFQWFHDGVPLAGRAGVSPDFEPTVSLRVTNLTEAHEGSYWLTVSNDRGTTESRRAGLGVAFAPRIVQHPAAVTAGDGQDVTFAVRAVGRPPLAIRWQWNGVDVPGAVAADLSLPGVQPGQAGSYRALVTNAWGSATSDAATLTVSGSAPVIRRQPLGTTNVVGSRIVLSVLADGSRPMTYQWSHDGVALAGQVAADLVLPAAGLSDSGSYTVRVTNGRGTVTSAPAMILLVVPPPNDDFVRAYPIVRTNYPVLESGYNIGATRENAEPGHDGPPAAQSVWWTWRSPARGLASVVFTNTTFAPRLGVYTGPVLGELQDVPYRTPLSQGTLVWLTEQDTDYAMAIDRAGTLAGDLAFRFAFTTNLAPPLILRAPVDKVVQACEELVLEVVATNRPTNLRYPLAYQWRFGDLEIPGATEATYRVPAASRRDAGLYSVRVSNYGGSVESTPIRCDIRVGPQFSLQPSDLALRLCESSQLRALGTGCPPIEYQWWFEESPIPGATNPVLPLPRVELGAAGRYAVVMVNPDGSNTSRVAQVRVDPAPRILSDTLGQVTVRECAPCTFSVSADTGCLPLSYQWYFNRTRILPEATGPELHLPHVSTNDAGEYLVVVANQHTATTSRVARLTVSALPLIPGSQPADRLRVRLGDSFDLRVDAASCTPMTYRWLYNGLPGVPGLTNLVTVTNFATPVPQIVQLPMIGGVDGPQLTFTRPTTNLSGRYRVEIRNSAGLATSRDAIVEILEPPPNDHFRDRIDIPGTNATVTGHDIIATREPAEPVHGGGPRAERSVWWTWQAPEEDGYLTVDLAGSTYDTLLAAYAGDDLGGLRALASDDNGGGNNTSRITGLGVLAGSRIQLAVDGRSNAEGRIRLNLVFLADTNIPVFVLHPKSVAALPGGSARFEVEVARTPRIAFQWRHNGTDLAGQTNRVLVVSDVQRSREGAYECVARNRYGATASRTAWLTTGGIVHGQVKDATNKRPIPYARVSVGEGATEVFTLTDTNGNYELIGARPGSLRADFDADRRVVGLLDDVHFVNRSTLDAALLACAATNYYRYEDPYYQVTPGAIVTNSFSLSPVLLGGLRFVLNWGLNPADLDLHVRTPALDGSPYEIDYRNPYRGSVDVPPFGQLDADERRSYGPETVTLSRFGAGRYQVFVQKFDPGAAGELATSQATVKVYDNQGLVRVVDVPRTGSGRFWHVLDIDGASRQTILVNRIVELLPPPALHAVPDADGSGVDGLSARAVSGPARRLAGQGAGRASYVWDFGDGSRSTSADAVVPHRYPRPGVFTVSLAMQAVVGGAPTNVATVRRQFITVTNDPPRVRIDWPLADSVVRLGSPGPLEASAFDSDGTVVEVAFFANGRPLGSVTAPPWTREWIPDAEERITLVAVATDNHGARGTSAPIEVKARDLWGDVLIVGEASEPEIGRMKELCEEVRCIDDQPLVVRILDRSELTFPLMKTFRLIVWNHLASTNRPLTSRETALFRQCFEFGIPLYFLGEDLASMHARQDAAARADWERLSHLRVATGKIGPARLENAVPGGHHDLLYSAHSEFAPFAYAGRLDAASADPAADVLLTGGGAPVLLAYPSVDQDTGRTRIVTQNFRVLDPDSGGHAEVQREQLFRSAVAWAIQCPMCPQLDLQLRTLASLPGRPSAGEPLAIGLVLRHSGACDPTGVRVTAQLPAGLKLLDSTPSEVVRDGDSLIFHLGRLANGFETNLAFRVNPSGAGTLRFRVCAAANGRDSYPADDCQELVVEVGATAEPMRLRILRGDPGPRLELSGIAGRAWVLEASGDLIEWVPVKTGPEGGDDASLILDPAGGDGRARFYRVRAP